MNTYLNSSPNPLARHGVIERTDDAVWKLRQELADKYLDELIGSNVELNDVSLEDVKSQFTKLCRVQLRETHCSCDKAVAQ